jgi:hypothetical protein
VKADLQIGLEFDPPPVRKPGGAVSSWSSETREAPQARARRTDPETSREAASSFTALRLTEIQEDVLAFFRSHGPATDEELRESLKARHPAESTLRNRRVELVQRGLIRDTGTTKFSENGRRMIVWECV